MRRSRVFMMVLAVGLALPSGAPCRAGESKDVASARKVFEANLAAIAAKDRDAYLATYLDEETLARTGLEGPKLGFAAHAEQSRKDPWPVVFEGHDLQLVPVRPGVVYGTYRYRVRYEAGEEHAGLSERLFLETKKGWKIAVTSAFDAPPGTPPPPRALVGATLIDGTGGAPVPDAVVVMRGGKIDCAGSGTRCPVPEGIETLDLKGLFVTPGIIDAHVHFSQTGWADGRPDSLDLRDAFPYDRVEAGLKVDPERWFRSYLCSGVTAVFDVGGYPWTWTLREPAESDTSAPHVAAAGPLLSTIDHWLNLPAERQFIYLADEKAAREGVSYLASQGTDAVKLWLINSGGRSIDDMLGPVIAAGEEARSRHLPFIVHATGLLEAKMALRAGATMLVHSVWDQPVDDDFISKAKAQGTIYCPTLTVIDGYARMFHAAVAGTPPEIDDPGKCVDAETIRHVLSTPSAAAGKAGPENEARFANIGDMHRTMAANLKRVQDAGIPVAMGTDAGNPLTLHGPSVYAEMEAMEAAGLTPMQVLVDATKGGALAMARSKDLGTIEAGKIADLLVVGADPSAAIRNMREIRWVVRGGVVRAPAEFRDPGR